MSKVIGYEKCLLVLETACILRSHQGVLECKPDMTLQQFANAIETRAYNVKTSLNVVGCRRYSEATSGPIT